MWAILLLLLSLPFHFTLSDVLLSENETQKAQTKHKELKDKMTQMDLILYYSSNVYSSCTRTLISHLHFPLILTPLGLKLLTNHRGSPPVSPCLLPSHLPGHTKTPPQTKTRITPNRQIPNPLRQTTRQVLTALS